MKRFKVVGNRQTLYETILWESDSLTEAKRWVDRYTERNDGGWSFIEVIEEPEDERCKTKIHYGWESIGDDGSDFD